jgi:hypothetical protein
MKLATFIEGQSTRVGVVENGHIADLKSVDGLPTDMSSLLSGGPPCFQMYGRDRNTTCCTDGSRGTKI